MTPDRTPPNTDALAAAALAGGFAGFATGYLLAREAEDFAPDAVLFYDAPTEGETWGYE